MPDPNVMQAAYELFDGLLKDPKTRRTTLEAMKQHKPDMVVPELDVAKPYDDKIQAANDRIEKLEKELAEKEASARLNSAFDKLRTRGLTDEGIEKVKKLMVDRSIPNPDDAAAVFAAQNPPPPPAEPVGYAPTTFFDDGDKDLEPWLQNEDRQADVEVQNVLREMRSQSIN